MRIGLLSNYRMYRKALLTVIFASDECTFQNILKVPQSGVI